MATVLEARAIITAEDRTGAAFAAVERHIAAIGKQASAINAVSRQVSGVSSGVAEASRGIAARSAMLSMGAGLAVGAAGAAGAVAIHEIAKAGANRVHERVRMEASGMTRSEIRDAESEASKLAREFPAIGQTEFMHMLRNARSIVGSYSEAAEIMQPLAKLRVIAQGARPGEDVSEDFDQLVKGLEIKGVTQNPKQFREYMEGIAKGLNVFGDTLKPYQYYEMFKYGRQATPGLSEKFILSTAPTLAQELGGSSYGKAVAAFNSAVVSNVMKHSAIKDFVSLGLVDKNDVLYNKSGDAKGFKPGKHVHGWQLAQSDPNEWVKQYLIPALTAAGVTDKGDLLQRIGALFQNQAAGQMVGLLATQQARIDKDADLLRGAQGLNAADQYMKNDPHIAYKGLKESLDTLFGNIGEQFMGSVTPAMTGITEAANKINSYFADRKKDEDSKKDFAEHPAKLSDAAAGLGDPFRTGSHPRGVTKEFKKAVDAKLEDLNKGVLSPDEEMKLKLEKVGLQQYLEYAKKNHGFFQRNWSDTAQYSRLQAVDEALQRSEDAKRAAAELAAADTARRDAEAAFARGRDGFRQYPPSDPNIIGGYDGFHIGPSAFPMAGASGKGWDNRPGVFGAYGDNGAAPPSNAPNTLKLASPSEQLAAALSNIKLDPVDVSGTATVEQNLNIKVDASPELRAMVADVQKMKAFVPLSSTGHHSGALGPSMPEAAPNAAHGGQ